MNIGYACQTVGIADTGFRSCIIRTATESKLLEIIAHNLNSLDHILDYNHVNGIQLFRITSDLIPFGSSPVNILEWWDIFDDKFQKLGSKIQKYNTRVSMHPGQYTVLNSPNEEVVERAILDLEYHCRVLDCLHTGKSSKIILHIGGIYQDKEKSVLRFIDRYKQLRQNIKDRLVIENDDKMYTISDVLEISADTKAPVIFDNLHYKINPGQSNISEFDFIELCKKTWREQDGVQKIHYSQQNPDKKAGSHSDSIDPHEFLDFYHKLNRQDIDIMLEVKDKNQSAIKCINMINNRPDK